MTDRGEIKSLTGLRGMAACFVMAYHFFQSSATTGPVRELLLHGYLAVDMFFVLSGFVIAMIYGDRFASGFSADAYGGFLVRRIGRVYPLYIAVTAFVIVCQMLGLLGSSPMSQLTLASNILLLQGWGFADSINGTSWSISTELAAYLLFPLIAYAILRGSMIRAAIAVVVAGGVLLAIGSASTAMLHQFYEGTPSRNGPLDIFGTGTLFPLARCLAGFGLGVAAFRLRGAVGPSFGRAADPFALAVVGLLTIRGSDTAFVLMCVPLVVALAASDKSLVARLLAMPVIYWLGLISYSIYLVHRLVDEFAFYPLFYLIERLDVPHPFSIARVAVIGVVVLVSAATYYAIESPARDAVRHMIRRRRIIAA